MSFTCPTCHAPFTLVPVPVRPTIPAASPAEVAFAPWACPVHHRVKQVPAGVSRKSGRPYAAFAACPEDGCSEKQPYGSQQAAAPGPSASLPQYQAGDLDELPF
jgi:hypothetical protein